MEGVPEEMTFKANRKYEQELKLATQKGKRFRGLGMRVTDCRLSSGHQPRPRKKKPVELLLGPHFYSFAYPSEGKDMV